MHEILLAIWLRQAVYNKHQKESRTYQNLSAFMKKACEEMPELVRAGGGKRSGRAAECGQTYEERRTYQNVFVFTRIECSVNFLNWCVQE